MARTGKAAKAAQLSEDATAIAEAQAAKDAELLAKVQERDANPESQPEPPKATIADGFVQMNRLIAKERAETRLSEATLTKTLELAMNFHVWETQRAEQKAAQSFDPAQYGFPASENGGEGTSEGEGPETIEPHEFLGAAEDDPETTTSSAEAEQE